MSPAPSSLAAALLTLLAAEAPGVQQLPISGCAACAGGAPRGFSTLLGRGTGGTFIGPRRWYERDIPIRLVLPPMPLTDEGAIEVAVAVVAANNPRLREALLLAGPFSAAPPATPRVKEDLYLTISKAASVVPIRRDHLPKNGFPPAAIRSVPYPQWQPLRER